MSDKEINSKLDNLLGIDIEKIINDADKEVSKVDEAQLQRVRERNERVEKLQKDLEMARNMPTKEWGRALLKNSAEKLVVVQDCMAEEIKINPVSKNVTSISELSNALTATVNAVMDVDREDEKMKIAQEKNDLRRMEIEQFNGGKPTIEGFGQKIIGVGSNDDLLKMLKKGIDPTKLIGDKDATSNTK
jgi:hypothetical protein